MLVACSALLAVPAFAQDQAPALRLPKLFSDHMVFQQRADAPIWGQTAPGAPVTVHASWDGGDASGTADASGRFSVTLKTPAAGGPFTVEIKSGATITLRDVLVGEVWIGSGQSNMEMCVAATSSYSGVKDWQQEVATASSPQIRLFTVENTFSKEPMADVRGSWKPCSQETVGPFSATLYFFGRRLYRELAVPIGLISSDWGGTVAEAWMSPQALEKHGGFEPALKALASMPSDLTAARVREQRAAWWKALEVPASDSAGWGTMSLPQAWSGTELLDFDGVVWLEREVELPAGFDKQRLTLTLPAVDDMDVVCWNGAVVAGTYDEGRWKQPRRYTIPAASVRAGKSRLSIGVLDTGGEGGVIGQAQQMAIAHGKESVPLAGAWRWHKGKALADLPPLPRGRGHDQNTPSALFHGMIEPLVPFAIAGFTWYQGESNRMRAAQYRTLFPALIGDWRSQWKAELPFYFVQIAPFGYADDAGEASQLRAAQAEAQAVPKTGMAVTADIGDPKDIHPADKQTVGDRLARHALHKTYGKAAIACESPRYESMEALGDALKVTFAHAGSGLVAKDGALRAFQVAGKDGVFHPAEAKLDGRAVVVRSAQVQAPTAVRFAWGAADESGLFSSDGLPVGPFRAER
jgi:sialate O-acetylesterase